jgi:hypothetical protein
VLASCVADATIAESAHWLSDCALVIRSRERPSFNTKSNLVMQAAQPVAAELEPALPCRKGKSSAIRFVTVSLGKLGARSSLPPAAQQTSS